MADTRRRRIMAQEQAGVDQADRCLELRKADDTAAGAVYQAHNEMPAPGTSAARKRASAGGDDPLVIMRVGLDDGDSFLIGRKPVWDEKRDLLVVSSAAQKAIEWRLATPDDPGEVLLRRRLQFQRRRPRTLTGFFDDLVLEQAGSRSEVAEEAPTPALAGPEVYAEQVPQALQEFVTPTAAEVRPVPEAEQDDGTAESSAASLQDLLLEDLDLPRDGTMRDIVETVQREQLLLVAHQRPGALVIQGGPGTGKTAVGLYRVMWLLDNQHCSAADVLVVGPHQGFLDYARHVLPALGGGDVTTLTLDRLLSEGQSGKGPVVETDSPEAVFLKGDDRMADVLRRAAEAGCRPTRTRVAPLLTKEPGTASMFRFRCQGRTYEVEPEPLLALAREALRESGPLNVRQSHFRLRLAGKLLLSVPGATPTDILDSKEVGAFVQRVWPRLNGPDLYARLLASAKLLTESSPLLTPEERSELHRRSTGKAAWTAADLVCLDELDWLLNGAGDRRTYSHLVIDEAQDLSPMQARALARRCPSGSLTVLGDLAQATGPHAYRSWSELAALLTGGAAWTVEILQAGFRLPPEVADFVEPLAKAAAPRVPVARSVRPVRDGRVHLRSVGHPDELAEAVAAHVVEVVSAGDGRSTAVITPADESLQDRLSTELSFFELQTVPVLTPNEAKGIEFDHVVVVEPAAIAGATDSGSRGLYVALTRCTQSLAVIHHAPLPVPLGGSHIPESLAPIAPVPTTEEHSPAMPSQPATPAQPAPTAEFTDFLAAAVAIDRRQSPHERLRHRLMSQLWESGEPQEGPTADIIRTNEAGTHLFEVLHAEEPTYADLREAATRTTEIRYTLDQPVDRAFLVCGAAPVEPWAVATAEGVFGVSVIWWEVGMWHGSDSEMAIPPVQG
ncbi:MAG: hypothetical protein LBV60_24450 [Streptomyces sp.]|jgi:hypothetical protein|nr:hypothetical protein [Streptomyces sp.]